MPSRGRWEESDQLLCLPETKSSPLVRLRGEFSVSFRILREKKIGCRRLGSARKYFHWSLQAQTSHAQSSQTTRIMIMIITFLSQPTQNIAIFWYPGSDFLRTSVKILSRNMTMWKQKVFFLRSFRLLVTKNSGLGKCLFGDWSGWTLCENGHQLRTREVLLLLKRKMIN